MANPKHALGQSRDCEAGLSLAWFWARVHREQSFMVDGVASGRGGLVREQGAVRGQTARHNEDISGTS